jgi:hypothetical protein
MSSDSSHAHFEVPLNLPHAGTIATRIAYHLDRMYQVKGNVSPEVRVALSQKATELAEMLDDCRRDEENPPEVQAKFLVQKSAKLAREIVDGIEAAKIGDDRLGQAIRNFFECLQLGQEGAKLSLRAGENPNSALRPI